MRSSRFELENLRHTRKSRTKVSRPGERSFCGSGSNRRPVFVLPMILQAGIAIDCFCFARFTVCCYQAFDPLALQQSGVLSIVGNVSCVIIALDVNGLGRSSHVNLWASESTSHTKKTSKLRGVVGLKIKTILISFFCRMELKKKKEAKTELENSWLIFSFTWRVFCAS